MVLHIEKGDMVTNDEVSGTKGDTQKPTGVVTANIRGRQVKENVTQWQQAGNSRNGVAKERPDGQAQHKSTKAAMAKSEPNSRNGRPGGQKKGLTEAEKKDHPTRYLGELPEGWRAIWSDEGKAWYYAKDGKSLWEYDIEKELKHRARGAEVAGESDPNVGGGYAK